MSTSASVIVLRGYTSFGPHTVDLFPCRVRDCPPIDVGLTSHVPMESQSGGQ